MDPLLGKHALQQPDQDNLIEQSVKIAKYCNQATLIFAKH